MFRHSRDWIHFLYLSDEVGIINAPVLRENLDGSLDSGAR